MHKEQGVQHVELADCVVSVVGSRGAFHTCNAYAHVSSLGDSTGVAWEVEEQGGVDVQSGRCKCN